VSTAVTINEPLVLSGVSHTGTVHLVGSSNEAQHGGVVLAGCDATIKLGLVTMRPLQLVECRRCTGPSSTTTEVYVRIGKLQGGA
jgi:hypothetical protein